LYTPDEFDNSFADACMCLVYGLAISSLSPGVLG
jgi:hypothetical protein